MNPVKNTTSSCVHSTEQGTLEIENEIKNEIEMYFENKQTNNKNIRITPSKSVQ